MQCTNISMNVLQRFVHLQECCAVIKDCNFLILQQIAVGLIRVRLNFVKHKIQFRILQNIMCWTLMSSLYKLGTLNSLCNLPQNLVQTFWLFLMAVLMFAGVQGDGEL